MKFYVLIGDDPTDFQEREGPFDTRLDAEREALKLARFFADDLKEGDPSAWAMFVDEIGYPSDIDDIETFNQWQRTYDGERCTVSILAAKVEHHR